MARTQDKHQVDAPADMDAAAFRAAGIDVRTHPSAQTTLAMVPPT